MNSYFSVGEIGGYLGLILGVSILDLEKLLVLFQCNKMNKR